MPRMLQPGADRSDARDDLAVRRALGDREEQVGDAIGIGLVGGHRCRRPLWCRRKGGEQQDQVQLEQVAKLGLREAMDMEPFRSEEHTSELQSLMRISYAVFCLKKQNN